MHAAALMQVKIVAKVNARLIREKRSVLRPVCWSESPGAARVCARRPRNVDTFHLAVALTRQGYLPQSPTRALKTYHMGCNKRIKNKHTKKHMHTLTSANTHTRTRAEYTTQQPDVPCASPSKFIKKMMNPSRPEVMTRPRSASKNMSRREIGASRASAKDVPKWSCTLMVQI